MPFCCGCLWVSVFRKGSIWWVPLGKEFFGKEFYGSSTNPAIELIKVFDKCKRILVVTLCDKPEDLWTLSICHNKTFYAKECWEVRLGFLKGMCCIWPVRCDRISLCGQIFWMVANQNAYGQRLLYIILLMLLRTKKMVKMFTHSKKSTI